MPSLPRPLFPLLPPPASRCPRPPPHHPPPSLPGVREERLAEGLAPRHCALSLVGEPIMYPHINRLVALLHARRISTFLVTNAQFPDRIAQLAPVTQVRGGGGRGGGVGGDEWGFRCTKCSVVKAVGGSVLHCSSRSSSF